MVNPDLALAESVSTTNASYFIVVYILILIYCCFGLAVVCDVYFVPALQKLSEGKYTNNHPTTNGLLCMLLLRKMNIYNNRD